MVIWGRGGSRSCQAQWKNSIVSVSLQCPQSVGNGILAALQSLCPCFASHGQPCTLSPIQQQPSPLRPACAPLQGPQALCSPCTVPGVPPVLRLHHPFPQLV